MQAQDYKRKNIKNYRKRKNIRKIFGLIFIAILSLYIPSILIVATTTQPTIEYLLMGTIKDSAEISGIVIKDEEIFIAEYDGKFKKNAIEGEKVPAGYTVASLVNNQYLDVFNEIQRLNNEIVYLKQRDDISSGIFTRDLRNINEEMMKIIANMSQSLAKGVLHDLQTHRYQLQHSSEHRNSLMIGGTSSDSHIQELAQKSNQLLRSIESQITQVKATNPGYVSYIIDGFEKEYDKEEFLTMPLDELESFINEQSKYVKDESQIQKGSPFMKIVSDHSYQLAFVMKNEWVEKAKQQNNLIFHLDSPNVTVRLNDMRIQEQGQTHSSVYFTVNQKLNELAGLRFVSGELVFTEYTGLKVPTDSLMNFEFYPYREIQLAVLKDIWVEYLDVEVVFKNQKYAIIQSKDHRFSLYDRYILKPKEVEEGQIIR